MASVPLSITQKGQLYSVGNNASGFSTFRLNYPDKSKGKNIEQAKLKQIAEHVYSSMQSQPGKKKIPTEKLGDKEVYVINVADFFKASPSAPKTGKGFWHDLVMRIVEFFERIFTPKKYEARQARYAERLVSSSTKKVSAIRSFSHNKDLGCIPKEIMLTKAETQCRLRRRDIGAKASVHSESPLYKSVSAFTSGDFTVTGYKINAEKGQAEKILVNRVIPTAFRFADSKSTKRDRLTNCYMASDGKHAILRTGVVDSKNKAKEFILAAQELHTQRNGAAPTKNHPLRIISHQLNSLESEEALVKNQHLNLAMQELQAEDIEIIHINTPCNKYFDITKVLKRNGLQANVAEEKARQLNKEGMAKYLLWLYEDLESLANDLSFTECKREQFAQAVSEIQKALPLSVTELKSNLKQINQIKSKLQQVEDLVAKKNKALMGASSSHEEDSINSELKEMKAEIITLEQQIDTLRAKLWQSPNMSESASVFSAIYTVLKDTIEGQLLQGEDSTISREKEKVTLFRKLLGNLYLFTSLPESELMDRGQEFLMYQLLNHRFGAISAINCKSGLDRTGLLFSMIMGLLQCPESQAMKLAMEWDQLSQNLNSKIRDFNYDSSKLDQWIEGLGNPLQETYRCILDFRRKVFDNLVNISLPIIAISSGLFGLKWGTGSQQNLVPLNFIPPTVQTLDENGRVEQIRIVNYTKNGQIKELTKAGHRLLTQLSARR